MSSVGSRMSSLTPAGVSLPRRIVSLRRPVLRQPVLRRSVPRRPVPRRPAPRRPVARRSAPRRPVARRPAPRRSGRGPRRDGPWRGGPRRGGPRRRPVPRRPARRRRGEAARAETARGEAARAETARAEAARDAAARDAEAAAVSEQLERSALLAFYRGDYNGARAALDQLISQTPSARAYLFRASSQVAAGLLGSEDQTVWLTPPAEDYQRAVRGGADPETYREFISPRILQLLRDARGR